MANNIQHEIKGDKLHIIIDVSKSTLNGAAPSSTGKTKLVASTHGQLELGNNLKLGLNLMLKN